MALKPHISYWIMDLRRRMDAGELWKHPHDDVKKLLAAYDAEVCRRTNLEALLHREQARRRTFKQAVDALVAQYASKH